MKPFTIYADGQKRPKNSIRPAFVYADGNIEKDMAKYGGQCDYFFLSASAKRILDKDGYAKVGSYPCVFEGKPVTMYVWNSCGNTEGLCCYDDDEESKAYIKKELERHFIYDLSPEMPKMENNRQKHNQVISAMKEQLIMRNSHEHLAAEIYGKLVYLTEREVRALQVLAVEKAKQSEEEWREFCANVVVYSNSKKKNSYQLHWKKDGRFYESMETGFFDVCGSLTLVLYKEDKIRNEGKEDEIQIKLNSILNK